LRKIRAIFRRLISTLRGESREYSLSPSTIRVWDAIIDLGGKVRKTDLASHLKMAESTIRYHLEKLKRERLIEDDGLHVKVKEMISIFDYRKILKSRAKYARVDLLLSLLFLFSIIFMILGKVSPFENPLAWIIAIGAFIYSLHSLIRWL